MPVQTGFGPLTLGRDITIDAVLPSGQHLQIANITAIDRKNKTKKLSSMGIDGMHRYAVVPETWELSLEIDRQDNTVDDFFTAVEEAYFNGQNVENCTITEIISEANGTLSVYRYEGCALSYDDAGNFKADAFVRQKISAQCSRRRRVQ